MVVVCAVVVLLVINGDGDECTSDEGDCGSVVVTTL